MRDPQRTRQPWHTRPCLPRLGAVGLAGAALLLLFGGVSPADEAPKEPASILAAARAAVAEGRTEKSPPRGSYDARRSFTVLPAQGAVLVGFDCGMGKFFDVEVVYALRAIFQTPDGRQYFEEHGLFADKPVSARKVIKSRVIRTVRVAALSGYAVAGVTIRSGHFIDGLSLTYMRINGPTLDGRQSYTSEWVGNRSGGGEGFMGGTPTPIVGIFGSQDDERVMSLGLIFMSQPAQAAAAPPEPPPVEVLVPPAIKLPPVKPPEQPPPLRKIDPLPKGEDPPDPLRRPDRPADPAQKAAEPVAQAPAEADTDSAKPSQAPGPRSLLLPLVAVGAIAAPIFLFFLVSWGRKKPDTDQQRQENDPASRPGSAPPPLPPSDSTAICERPGRDVGQRSQPADEEEILEVLPAPRRPKAEDAAEKSSRTLPPGEEKSAEAFMEIPSVKPVRRDVDSDRREEYRGGTDVSRKRRKGYVERPWWVQMGLVGIRTRGVAWGFFWLSVFLTVAPGLLTLFAVKRYYFCGLFIFAALWYWLCIRWMDEHGEW